MKKILSVILSAVITLNVFSIVTFSDIISAEASSYSAQLLAKGFPESYVDALVELHEKYPNWIFEPLDTGLDWSYAVSQERSPHSDQLIQKTSSTSSSMYCSCSSCYKNGSYVIQESSNWVSASEEAVEYYMDPRNWLTEEGIFQFESTEYDGTQTISGIETILSGTWMYNSKISYKNSSGTTKTLDTTYSESILKAANNSGLSAYYLASKIRQEVGGTSATAGGASGTNSTYPGIYNYYNIGAYTGATDGLKWASTSSVGYYTNCACYVRQKATTSSSALVLLPSNTTVTYKSTTSTQSDGYKWYYVTVTYSGTTYTGYIRSDLVDYSSTDSYGRPWTDPDKSIYYGAVYIANNYATQQTGYLQKFNVNPESSNRFSHEYMTNVAAAASESSTTYKAYKSAGILSVTKTFLIPVYDNMPNSGHNYSIEVLKYATTTEDGQIQKTCSDCGKVVTETIAKASKITLSRTSIAYTGTVQRPTVTVTDSDGNALTYKEDFTVDYSNWSSKNVGTYSVTVKFIGYYSGSKTYTYKITSQTSVTPVLNRNTITMNGTVQRPTVTVTDKYGNKLTYKKDFTVDYSNWSSTAVGRYTVTVTMMGNYSGTKTYPYYINPKSTTISSVTGISKGFTVKWNKQTNSTTGYQIQYATKSDFSNAATIYAGPSSSSSKTITGRATKTKYYVRIRTYKNIGGKYFYSDWSSAKTVTTK